jgi:hypothetical protein
MIDSIQLPNFGLPDAGFRASERAAVILALFPGRLKKRPNAGETARTRKMSPRAIAPVRVPRLHPFPLGGSSTGERDRYEEKTRARSRQSR